MPDDPAASLPRVHNPAGKLLGMQILAVDRAAGRARVAFDAGPELCNPIGTIQGGFQAAMLDEAMAIAAVAAEDFQIAVPTLDLRASYLNAARPGRLEAEGWVVRMGRSVCFLEARLTDADGTLVATGQATARVVRRVLAGPAG
jgi:uncharacterized protein (TIGR00369 family)